LEENARQHVVDEGEALVPGKGGEPGPQHRVRQEGRGTAGHRRAARPGRKAGGGGARVHGIGLTHSEDQAASPGRLSVRGADSCVTTSGGRRLVSMVIPWMYSPIKPKHSNYTPPMNIVLMINEVQPLMTYPRIIFDHRAYKMMTTEIP